MYPLAEFDEYFVPIVVLLYYENFRGVYENRYIAFTNAFSLRYPTGLHGFMGWAFFRRVVN